MSITIDIDLRGKLGEVRDQRERPTCLVFAVSGAHEESRAANDYLSVEFLFYTSTKRPRQFARNQNQLPPFLGAQAAHRVAADNGRRSP